MEQIIQLENDPLTNYYILPMLKLGKPFIEGLITSKVNPIDGKILIFTNVQSDELYNHIDCVQEEVFSLGYIYTFDVPQIFIEDLFKFQQGKYSEFTELLKSYIIQYSGLQHNIPTGKKVYDVDPITKKVKKVQEVISNEKIMILFKDERYQLFLEELLDIELNQQELLDKPNDTNFIISASGESNERVRRKTSTI